MESNQRRVISLLVDNQSGVLARVSNLFCRRGFNIDSLTVSATNDPTVSRITVSVSGTEKELQQLILQPEAGEAPDILPGIAAADLPQEGQQVTLVPGLEGLTAQHRQSADEGLVQLPEDLRLRLVGEGPAVAEVPGLGLEAVGAVVGAAGDEQRHPDSGSVGDITFFQGSVVHDMVSFR